MKHQFGPFWPIFGLMARGVKGMKTSKIKNFKILRQWFHKRITYVKFLFTIDFYFSLTIGTWNTNLDLFWPNFGLMTLIRESKLQYFEKVISEVNSSLQSSIKYWFRSFYRTWYMTYNFGLFLTSFEIMTSQEK